MSKVDIGEAMAYSTRNKNLTPSKAAAEFGIVTVVGIEMKETPYSENAEAVLHIKEGGGLKLWCTCAGLRSMVSTLLELYDGDIEELSAALFESPQKLRIGELQTRGNKRFRLIEYVRE